MAEMLYELTILNDIAKTMGSLKKDEQRRILMWLEDYFEIYEDDIEFETDDTVIEPLRMASSEVAEYGDEDAMIEADEPKEDTVASFFDEVHPKTAIQKIVCAAYWLETKDDKESWKSFEVNKLLKSLDIKVSSVSGTLALEAKKDDSMIVVLDKSSDSMQGRKTFKLSEAGYAFVEARRA